MILRGHSMVIHIICRVWVNRTYFGKVRIEMLHKTAAFAPRPAKLRG